MAAAGLWPRTTRTWRRTARKGIVVTFFIGLAPVVLSIIIVLLMSKLPKFGAFAVLFAAAVVAWGLIGVAGFAARIGERMWPGMRGTEPWREMRNGGLVLACTALLPIIGWVFILPILSILGMGLQIRAWFHRDEVAPLASPPALPESVMVAAE